jgi:hypothetical protein
MDRTHRGSCEFTDSHHVPADIRELVAHAIAMHYTPGVGLESGAEAYLLSAGASVDVFGLRSHEIPDAVRQSVIQEYPRLGFKREFARLEHSARALPWFKRRAANACSVGARITRQAARWRCQRRRGAAERGWAAAHSMHSTTSGIASSRFDAIGFPHASHSP